MDKESIFRYFTKPKLTLTEQNYQSANSTNQIPLTVNYVLQIVKNLQYLNLLNKQT